MLLIAATFLPESSIQAQVRVRKPAEITQSIDLSNLSTETDRDSRLFLQTLQSSLTRFGWFKHAAPGRGDLRLTGRQTAAGGSLQVRLELALDERLLLRRTYTGKTAEARRLAHRIHDDIVEAATGNRGIASTSLLIVGTRTGHKEMYWVDADGGNLRQVTRDRSISVAPAWAPDAKRFVYTSYVGGFPDVYLVELESGVRNRIAAYPGLNTSAAFSPDGRELALILSKDGNPELYVRNLRNERLTRLSHTRFANEASPSWSPDGSHIVYVSDSTGSPNLYMVARTGEGYRRLAVSGRHNVSPDWGPDGRIVFSSRRDSNYQLVVYDMESGEERLLTSGAADHEDPCWAPDGRHIAFTRSSGLRSAIYMLDTVTGQQVPLVQADGDWHSPVWSPR